MTLLSTERLVLRAPVEADRPAVLAGLRTPDLPNWFEKIVPPIGDADFDRLLVGEAGVERFVIERREDAALLGMLALYLDTGSGDYISYWLSASCRGAGYATEAVRALLQHGLVTRQRSRLLSTVHRGNERSHAMMARLDFEFVRHCDLKGKPGSLYRMTAHRWKMITGSQSQ